MSVEKLSQNVYSVGVRNPQLRIFDIIMDTKKGTTYNSYLVDDEKVAIIDTVKDGFYEEFIENIKSVIGDRPVDYIIVQHTELDHSGSLYKLLDTYKEAKVVATRPAITYLKDILNRDFNNMIIPQELNLGKSNLKFISAPNLHWPDTMFTYHDVSKILFSCDFLGCHYCPDASLVNSYDEGYMREFEYYYNVIMGPFKKHVLAGLEKIKDLQINMIAPSHGSVHSSEKDKYIKLYKEWSEKKSNVESKIQIFYVSAYGNTEKVAKYIQNKLNNEGYAAEAHELTKMDLGEALELANNASGILLGTPTINQDALKPIWDFLSLLCPITLHGTKAGAFGSYGWSGEGVPMVTARLKSLKFKVVEEGFRFKFVPGEEDMKRCDEFVNSFMELLK